MSLEPSREVCFSMLHCLYLLSGREAEEAVPYWQKIGAGPLSLEQVQGAVAWLQSVKLLRLAQEIGEASLTALGVATVERSLANPESSSDLFPALTGFYDLGENEAVGLCHTTLQVWLDQLDSCAGALESGSDSENDLEDKLSELEVCVDRCEVDPQSLRLSLLELKASL